MRRSVGRVRPWTVAHAEVERERTRELARIGANLNQIARWANTSKRTPRPSRSSPTWSPSSGRSRHWRPSGAPTPMHIKFLARGTGSARAAADYLLGARDATGQLRAGVEVLRGDPHRVAAVADALAFEHKYTSGVIAWAPDDTPTDAQIGAVIDAFEQTAWAGLEPDRYAWSAVVHRERDGGVHVHVLAARCDLETGRSLNIAPPGWQKTFDPLRDAFNAEHGWSRPDDPARARVQQPGHRAYVEAAHLRAGLALEPSPRDLIRDYLLQRVEHGTVRNRADIVAACGRRAWRCRARARTT